MDKEKRDEIIAQFDPDNSLATTAGIFGLPFELTQAEVLLYPVPWEVTVSYREGCANGPFQILKSSSQIDLYDNQFGEVWKKGIHLFTGHADDIGKLNNNLRKIAKDYISHLEQGGEPREDITNHINEASAQLNDTIKNVAKSFMEEGHKMGIVGGDHSTPLGFLSALAEKYEGFGILQIDAHADLREAYEGFTYSHASIMHNALALREEMSLVQVGVRDFAASEKRRIEDESRIKCFFDAEMKADNFKGKSWHDQAQEIVESLPEKVYISFDVDGLQADLCPSTGTPVPGGLSYEQACYLLMLMKESDKEIIGFDLSETGNGEWDGIVSSRILYKLCGLV